MFLASNNGASPDHKLYLNGGSIISRKLCQNASHVTIFHQHASPAPEGQSRQSSGRGCQTSPHPAASTFQESKARRVEFRGLVTCCLSLAFLTLSPLPPRLPTCVAPTVSFPLQQSSTPSSSRASYPLQQTGVLLSGGVSPPPSPPPHGAPPPSPHVGPRQRPTVGS